MDLSHIHLAVKFIYSEKASTFCEISTLLLSYVVPVKIKVEISQNFVAFSEYMNFKDVRNHVSNFLSFKRTHLLDRFDDPDWNIFIIQYDSTEIVNIKI